MLDILPFRYVDLIPLSVVLLFTTFLLFALSEMGFRASRRWPASQKEGYDQTSILVGAVLGLLAFMLSFSFGMASTRFDERKQILVDEANAIGATWLRSQMMPAKHAEQVRPLLQRYVELRLAGSEAETADELSELLAESVGIHEQLWKHAVALGEQYPESTPVGLFVESLNDVISLHESRLNVLQDRLARGVMTTLYVIAMAASVMIGINAGLAGGRSATLVLLLCFVLSMVIVLIIDLDRPDQKLFRVSQKPLADLLEGMKGSG